MNIFNGWSQIDIVRFFINEIKAMRNCKQNYIFIADYLKEKTGVEFNNPTSLRKMYQRELSHTTIDAAEVKAIEDQLNALLLKAKAEFLPEVDLRKYLKSNKVLSLTNEKVVIEGRQVAISMTEATEIFAPSAQTVADPLFVFIPEKKPSVSSAPSAAAVMKPTTHENSYQIVCRFQDNPLITTGADDLLAALAGGYEPFAPIAGFLLEENIDSTDALSPWVRPFAWLIEALRIKAARGDSGLNVQMRDGRSGIHHPLVFQLKDRVQQRVLKNAVKSWDEVDIGI